ncbi:MAG: hypothetical protein IPG53_19395 [Ignavibacteriales bacterium]|nr:hypothetical protein [Ignavibacteriales bacterium]
MIISIEQLLADLELSIEGKLNSIFLLGSNKAISRYQPQAEIVFSIEMIRVILNPSKEKNFGLVSLRYLMKYGT